MEAALLFSVWLAIALAGELSPPLVEAERPLSVEEVFPAEHPDAVEWAALPRQLPHPTWRPPQVGVLPRGAKTWAWTGRVSALALAAGTGLGLAGSPAGLPVAGAALGVGTVAGIGHTASLRHQGLEPNGNFLLAGLLCGGAALVMRKGVGVLFLPYAVASPFVQLAANSLLVHRHRRAIWRARPVESSDLQARASLR